MRCAAGCVNIDSTVTVYRETICIRMEKSWLTIGKKMRIILVMEPKPASEVLDTPRSLRVRLGLQQIDVADAAPMSVKTVCQIEAAGRVSVASVRKFAHVVRVTPGFVLDAMDRQRSLARRANLFKKGGGR